MKPTEPKPETSVWLVCWNSWDYDHHEDPREAYHTQVEAKTAAKAKSEGMYNAKNRSDGLSKNHREGWSVMEVEWGPRK